MAEISVLQCIKILYQYQIKCSTSNLISITEKGEIITLPLYGWNTASTFLNSKQSIDTKQQNLSVLWGYSLILFTCTGTMCNGIVHVYLWPNIGLPAQLIHVCNMYICIYHFLNGMPPLSPQ